MQGPAEEVEEGYRVAHEIMQREMAARGVRQPPPGTARVMPWPKAQPKPAAAGAPPKEAAPKPKARPKQAAAPKQAAPNPTGSPKPAPKPTGSLPLQKMGGPPPRVVAHAVAAPSHVVAAPPGLEHVVSTNSDVVAAPSDALADIEDLINSKSFREKQNIKFKAAMQKEGIEFKKRQVSASPGEKRKRKRCMVKLEEEPSSGMVKLEEEPSSSTVKREQKPSSSNKGNSLDKLEGEEPSSSTLQDVKIMVESLGDAPKKKQPQEKIVQKEVAAISFHRIGYNAVMNTLSLPKGPLAPPDGLATLYKVQTDYPPGTE